MPPALTNLIESFSKLPGVGPRTAERYALFMFRSDQNVVQKLSEDLIDLKNGIDTCIKTFALIPKGEKYSVLYTDPKRDKTVVAVVAEPFDIMSIENTNAFHGTYHVLGGLISPIDGVEPDKLRIKELIKRISEDDVKEIIMATNASVEGETTSMYIQKLVPDSVKVTRLARGLPIGADLEYADMITLSKALEGRQIF